VRPGSLAAALRALDHRDALAAAHAHTLLDAAVWALRAAPRSVGVQSGGACSCSMATRAQGVWSVRRDVVEAVSDGAGGACVPRIT
jgi:hypothetical protein